MRVNPKTEQEIASAGLLPAGDYGFEVTSAEDKVSKAGNEMVELKVKLFGPDGDTTVFDYLIDGERSAFKVRHFAEATGMLGQYERGDMPAHLMVGKTGRCKVSITKDKSGQYPDKNGIADYIKAANAPAPSRRPVAPPQDLDDDIPF